MSLHEIAKCLYKRNWADDLEWKIALRQYSKLSPNDQATVENIGTKYK